MQYTDDGEMNKQAFLKSLMVKFQHDFSKKKYIY